MKFIIYNKPKLLQTQRELNCSEYIDAGYTTIRQCQFVDQNMRPLSQNKKHSVNEQQALRIETWIIETPPTRK